jgi:Domain of unknown function (DUF4158)
MSAATQITEQQRRQLLTGHFALSHREVVRYWLLSEKDINGINGRRREYNRLGYAVQLCLLRYPGWPLKTDEPAPPNLLNYLGQQLGADTAEFADYAKRDNTRQEHQLLIINDYRFRQYGPAYSADLRRHLEIETLSTDAAFTLVESAMEWLRERKVILPALATLESVVRSVRSKVERDVYWRLFGRLAESHKKALNKLLELGPARGSLLGWLRRVPQSCSVAGILDLMHRLSWVRGTGFPRELADGIAFHRIDRLAARGSRHSLGHFRRFPPEKRYAILACFLLYVAEELTDRSIDFHRRLIGRMFRESEKKRWMGFVQQGPSVNEKLKNYSRLTAIIGRARKEGRNLESAIEKEFGWDVLELDGQESERLARPLNGSDFQDFRAQFPHFRRYTPLFIETFQFEGIPTQKPLLRALIHCVR